jgi:predicted branched-subunit amino acid permease
MQVFKKAEKSSRAIQVSSEKTFHKHIFLSVNVHYKRKMFLRKKDNQLQQKILFRFHQEKNSHSYWIVKNRFQYFLYFKRKQNSLNFFFPLLFVYRFFSATKKHAAHESVLYYVRSDFVFHKKVFIFFIFFLIASLIRLNYL